ncbi:DUF397 domain-containing protein [Streptomyces sp. NPDC020298]|uniref:DUF397 domain-containing protein n=1 Tax=unclassified Streptomyces TaxID=2593676 RepID=UPI0033FC43C8
MTSRLATPPQVVIRTLDPPPGGTHLPIIAYRSLPSGRAASSTGWRRNCEALHGHPDTWRKSSHSGPGDGDSCVEIANRRAHIAIRDSKGPAAGILTFPAGSFTPFIGTLKDRSALTDFARFRG